MPCILSQTLNRSLFVGPFRHSFTLSTRSWRPIPSAVNARAGLPLQRAIDCVLKHSLIPSFDRSNDPDLLRFDVNNQVFICRLFGVRQDFDSLYHLRRDFYYEEIRHTLAFDSYIANHPFLTCHIPIASMPPTWDPRAVTQANRPGHDPVLEAERAITLDNPDDPSDVP